MRIDVVLSSRWDVNSTVTGKKDRDWVRCPATEQVAEVAVAQGGVGMLGAKAHA